MTSIDDYDSGPDIAAEEESEELRAELSTLRTLTETQARELAELRNRHVIAAEELHAKWMQDPEYAKAWASGAGDRDIIDVYRKQLAAVTRERDSYATKLTADTKLMEQANAALHRVTKDLGEVTRERDEWREKYIHYGRDEMAHASAVLQIAALEKERDALLVRIAELEAGK